MTEPMMDRGTGVDATTVPPKPEKSSLLDDFMDIFYAPSKVFARRENSSFWIPLLIVSVLLGLIFVANRDLMEPIMEAEMSRAMAKQGTQFTEEQLKAARNVTGIIGTIGAFVFAPIGILLLGTASWLVGKFLDSKQTMNAAMMVAAFSYLPRVVEGIVTRVQGTLLDTSSYDSRFSFSLGLGRFLDPDTTSPFVLALLGRIDVFTIWVTILLAIGFAVTGKVSRGKAAIFGVVIWLVGALPQLAQGLR
jgi:hypothetical protein